MTKIDCTEWIELLACSPQDSIQLHSLHRERKLMARHEILTSSSNMHETTRSIKPSFGDNKSPYSPAPIASTSSKS